jgi:ankyrin repeat protein
MESYKEKIATLRKQYVPVNFNELIFDAVFDPDSGLMQNFLYSEQTTLFEVVKIARLKKELKSGVASDFRESDENLQKIFTLYKFPGRTVFPTREKMYITGDELHKYQECFKEVVNTIYELKKNVLSIDANDMHVKVHLFIAIEQNNIEIAELLKNKGVTTEGINPEIQKVLKKNEYNLNNSLFDAVRKNNIILIEQLLKCDANVNSVNESNQTPLHFAAHYAHLESVKYLVEKNANIDAVDKYKKTPLHWAAGRWELEVVKYLVEKNANIDAVDIDNHTPLHLAASNGCLDIVKYLVEKNANIDAVDKYNRTPLHLAAGRWELEVVKYLVENKANIDAVDERNHTPLHLAAAFGPLEVVKYLVAKNANIYAVDQKKKTPLHLALHYNQLEVAGYLGYIEREKKASTRLEDTSISAANTSGRQQG